MSQSLPTPEQVYASYGASFWLKDALKKAMSRDPLDAARDAELLALMLKAHCDKVLGISKSS